MLFSHWSSDGGTGHAISSPDGLVQWKKDNCSNCFYTCENLMYHRSGSNDDLRNFASFSSFSARWFFLCYLDLESSLEVSSLISFSGNVCCGILGRFPCSSEGKSSEGNKSEPIMIKWADNVSQQCWGQLAAKVTVKAGLQECGQSCLFYGF